MRDFVSMGVRGNSDFARKVTDFAKKVRGKPAGDYIRDLILADAGKELLLADSERQNDSSGNSPSAQRTER